MFAIYESFKRERKLFNQSDSHNRSETEIFDQLENLCSQSGIYEVIAFFCWKDCFIHTPHDTLDSDGLAQQHDSSKLSRTELSTLIGLACKNGFRVESLVRDELEVLSTQTWNLLEELHSSFYKPSNFEQLLKDEKSIGQVLGSGAFMREAIFYSGEGVFKHQYRDLSVVRYKDDNPWLEKNKGFLINQATRVISAIENLQLEKANKLIEDNKSFRFPSYLPIFKFTVQDVAQHSQLSESLVLNVIDAFSADADEGMQSFHTVDSFNHRNAFPIIKLNENEYLSFQAYSLWETLYESPFFWFNTDRPYSSTASKHRGAYTEDFTAYRLEKVFGKENVYTNIDIYDGKNRAGEIDVIVTFGSIAIIVQAKSKKLTIEARKGNSQELKNDFKKAIQDAYDQAYLCSELLQRKDLTYKNESGEEITIESNFKTIFPVCIVSDHYPALAAQARHFLKYNVTEKIKAPYIMDVFLIDLMAEMLESPLLFLDYLYKRSAFGDSVISNHELVILATYLKQNLYFEEQPDLVMLEDSISTDLELAMLARRDGVETSRTPSGMLTLHEGSHSGSILDDIKNSSDYGLLKLGFYLLSLSGTAIDLFNNTTSQMIELYKADGKNHDCTFPILDEKTGLTIHCNEDGASSASKRLLTHCEMRKYICKASTWVGLCFSPLNQRFRFSIFLEHPWEYSVEMDKLASDLPAIGKQHEVKDGKVNFKRINKKASKHKKVGRNDTCPCGSGKKYKHCCL